MSSGSTRSLNHITGHFQMERHSHLHKRCISRNQTDGGHGWQKAANKKLHTRPGDTASESDSSASRNNVGCDRSDVTGRLLALAKKVGVEKCGTSDTLNIVPFALLPIVKHETVTGVEI